MKRVKSFVRCLSWRKLLRLKIFGACILFPIAIAAFVASGSLILYQRSISPYALALAGLAGFLFIIGQADFN